MEINSPGLDTFFGSTFGDSELREFLDDMRRWLEGDAGNKAIDEAVGLTRFVPESFCESLGITSGALTHFFSDRMERFATEVSERWNLYTEKYSEAEREGQSRKKR